MIDQALSLVDVDPIAAVVVGSDLYNTKIEDHDTDIAIFVPTGKRVQTMWEDLDVQVISLEHLLKIGTRGYLYEFDAVLGLLYGYGVWYNHPWKPALQMYRPSIWGYADTIRRFKINTPEARKHIIRYDIFLKRFWETGNANPRLSDEERAQWLHSLQSPYT